MLAQSDDEPLDEGLEEGGERGIVPVVELLRQPVPQVEGDVGYLVVRVAAAKQDRVEDGDGEVRLRRRLRGHLDQEALRELGEDPAEVYRLENVLGGHGHVVRLLQLAHGREKGELEAAARRLVGELLQPLQERADRIRGSLVDVRGLIRRCELLRFVNERFFKVTDNVTRLTMPILT